MRNQAKTIREYLTEHLPEQYQICLTALDTIFKHAFQILETSDDNREKLQAMELFKDTHITKLELLSNATTIDSALEFIRSKQEQHGDKRSYSTQIEHEKVASSFTPQEPGAATGKQSVF